MNQLERDARFVLQDLKKFKVHVSWDHSADIRFARFIGRTADADTIEAFGKSGASKPLPMSKMFPNLRNRRMAALRFLVQRGDVFHWSRARGCSGTKNCRSYTIRGEDNPLIPDSWYETMGMKKPPLPREVEQEDPWI